MNDSTPLSQTMAWRCFYRMHADATVRQLRASNRGNGITRTTNV